MPCCCSWPRSRSPAGADVAAVVAEAEASEVAAGRQRRRSRTLEPPRARTSRSRGRALRSPAFCVPLAPPRRAATAIASSPTSAQPHRTFARPPCSPSTHSRAETVTVSAALVSTIPFEELPARVGAVTASDVQLGRTLFTRQGCAACHTASPEETEKGPYLGGIATRYSRAELLESLIRPAAKIAQGFATNFFDTTDGKHVEGFVVREGGTEVVIRDLAGRRDDAEEGPDQVARRPRGVDHAAGPRRQPDASGAGVIAGVPGVDDGEVSWLRGPFSSCADRLAQSRPAATGLGRAVARLDSRCGGSREALRRVERVGSGATSERRDSEDPEPVRRGSGRRRR